MEAGFAPPRIANPQWLMEEGKRDIFIHTWMVKPQGKANRYMRWHQVIRFEEKLAHLLTGTPPALKGGQRGDIGGIEKKPEAPGLRVNPGTSRLPEL